MRCHPTDHCYAHPVEGLITRVNLDTFAVTVEDLGVHPLPAHCGNYTAEAISDPNNVPYFPDGPRTDVSWHALAVGDSCLFQVRKDTLLTAFPVEHSDDFGTAPWLIGSRTPADGIPLHHCLYERGRRRPGDRLFLMTDALSKWFLAEHESGKRPWRAIEEFLDGPDEAFADWVGRLRSAKALKDDDTTLVVVSLY